MGKLLDSDAVKKALYDAVDDISLGYMAVNGIEEDDIEGIIDSVPPAQPEQRWILCSERLPEDDVEVLITDDSGGVQWLDIDRMLSYEDGSGRFWMASQNPIAWMPLPEPYQEGEHDE